MAQARTSIVPVQLPNGMTAYVEATSRGEQDIAARALTFDGVLRAVEGIAMSLGELFDRIKPNKSSVEFGLDFEVESGQLTALFVKGSGSGSLKITLEWGQSE